jgi:hypothetical protein
VARLIGALLRFTFGSGAKLWLSVWALSQAGCGEQEIRAIGRVTDRSEPTLRDRGRIQVREGNLLTDKGTRLRGVTFGLDNTEDLRFEPSFINALSKETGLNALHVYVENLSQETGARAEEADELVEMTSAAGMYLVLGLGGGPAGGRFSLEKLRSFWSFYAPRYASRTHVLYELQNIPDPACSAPFAAETLDMERDIHDLIRRFAPSTHVALFSFLKQPTASALEANLDALEGSIDWSKASVAFHTELCESRNNLAGLLGVARGRGIAAFASEMAIFTSFDLTKQLEAERVGWLSFEWLVRSRDLAELRAAHADAELSWCPDFGDWPESSETCSTP